MRVSTLLRHGLGLSQQTVSSMTKIRLPMLSMYESRGLALKDEQLVKLAEALGWDDDPNLLSEELDPKKLKEVVLKTIKE